MIRHIVLFRLNEGVTTSDARVQRACAAEVALAKSFPGVGWTFGPDVSERPGAADFAGVGEFASNEALQAFLAEPVHREAGRLWSGIADWIVADLDIDQPGRDG